MLEFKKILVIGGTGFVGGYLVKNLLNRSNLEIDLIYNGDLDENDKIDNLTYHQLDASVSSAQFSSLVQSSDCVVSLATPNLKLIENLLGNMRSGGPQKMIYTSTMLVYPDSDSLNSEDVMPEPLTDYEKDKVAEESLLKTFSDNSEVQICIARLSNVYGDVKNRGLVGYIMKALKNKSSLTINGAGNHRRDYIFVQDVANLLEFLIFNQQKNKFEIFNICRGQGYTNNEVISLAEEITGAEIEKKYGDPVKEKLTVLGDNHKIIGISDYKFKYDLTSGLKQACANYSIL